MVEMLFECGYCKTHIIKLQSQIIEGYEALRWDRCPNPNCHQLNLFIENNRVYPNESTLEVAEEVPQLYAEKYQKAHKILRICPDSSAAASRKCLELVLINAFSATQPNLIDKINEIKDKISLHLYEQLHCLREIGNFGAHPRKNTHTAELLSVEPGEAEYCLELLKELFDECFVKPKKRQEINKMVNDKISLAGKKPLKFSSI